MLICCRACARHEATLHQMYLQLRSDLLGDRFSCTAEQALLLGALSVRAEYPDGHQLDEVSIEHYLAPSVIRGPTRTSLHNSLMREVEQVVGLSRDLAKLQFIQVCFV